MPEYLAPGVYVEEIDTGSKPIEGVSTSTAGMLGVTERGPVKVPILVTSYGEYTRWFGGRLNKEDFSNGSDAHCYLPHAVEGFFLNGGKRAYISRILDINSATYSATSLFDRGTDSSANTLLLRAAGEGTGTAANLPFLYILDETHLSRDHWIRIGDGSLAEYRKLAADPDTTNITHVTLNFPLSRSHDEGVTVDQFDRVEDTTAQGGVYSAAFTLHDATQRGDQTIVIAGTSSGITRLKTASDRLLEIGDAGKGEYRFALDVTDTPIDTTHSLAHVRLDSGLTMSYGVGSTVTPLQKKWPSANPSKLGPGGAVTGDRLVFVDNRNGMFTSPGKLAIVDPDDTTGIREVRRVGVLTKLKLSTKSYDAYLAGSTVEVVALADDFSIITDHNPTAGKITVTVNDVLSLVRGQRVRVGAGSTQEFMTIRTVTKSSTTPPTGTLMFTTALAHDHSGEHITVAAKPLSATANAGASLIVLDDRLGLLEDDVIRIDDPPNEEFVTIKAIPNRASDGTAPDAGNVLLMQPLSLTHTKGARVWQEGTVTPGTLQPTTTVLDTPMGVNTLIVTDGSNYTQGNHIRLTTPANEVFFHDLAANEISEITTPTKLQPALVTLDKTLERAHGLGAEVVGRNPLIDVRALDAGAWGDRLRVSVEDEATGLVSKTSLITVINPTHIRLASAAGVEPGTVLELLDPDTNSVLVPPLKVESIDRTSNYTIVLRAGNGLSAAQVIAHNTAVAAGKHLGVRSREFRLTVLLLQQPDPALPSRNDTILTTEVFRYLSMDPRHSRYVQTIIGDIDGPTRLSDNRSEGESWYVRVHDLAPSEDFRLGPEALVDILPTGQQRPARQRIEDGDDSILTLTDDVYIGTDDPDPARRTGLFTFNNIDDISIVAAPGRTGARMQEALIDHCELLRYRFAVLDGPPPPDDSLSDVQAQRQQFDTKYAALYYPWVLIPDPFPTSLANIANFPIPPSGHILGIYARTDEERGVHKAPANEVVRGIIGLQRILNKSEQDILNPYPVNIDVIRDFRPNDRGLRVWGARVITSDTDWKYVNVRRLLIFIEASIDRGLQSVVFEPNAEPLWARVTRVIKNFLTVVWRNGALEGTKPEEAFFVKCDRTTMTQTDIDNGRLICVIGVAPVKPGEFVIIRIGLFTAQANT